MTDVVPIRRALISLSDKAGLHELAAGLARHGVEIVSTGGTAAKLREVVAEVRDVSELTGFPEMMDGRVKTLHPKVHGGLLGVRDNPEHAAAMAEHEIAPIDLVVVNLYPFLNTVMSGADQLQPKGRKKIRDSAAYAVRFHLAPGVEATLTADGMGAILRSKGAPPWNFRCRGANLTIEESLWIDGRGRPQRTIQLAILGEVSALGSEIGWQFRRTS